MFRGREGAGTGVWSFSWLFVLVVHGNSSAAGCRPEHAVSKANRRYPAATRILWDAPLVASRGAAWHSREDLMSDVLLCAFFPRGGVWTSSGETQCAREEALVRRILAGLQWDLKLDDGRWGAGPRRYLRATPTEYRVGIWRFSCTYCISSLARWVYFFLYS
jgi:hypothetical protein